MNRVDSSDNNLVVSAASIEPKRIPRLTGNYYHADVIKSRQMVEQQKLCGIKLNYGVKKINFIAFLIMSFNSYMSMSILMIFSNFILQDKDYYNLTPDQASKDVGQMIFLQGFFTITEDAVLGFIVDIYGRKGPLIFGQFLLSISLFCIPNFKQVYPWFFVARTVGMIGGGISQSIPLMPDYVSKNHIGKASSINQMIILVSQIFSQVCLVQIAATGLDKKWIYYGTSLISFIITIFLCFTIKDVINDETALNPKEMHIDNRIETEVSEPLDKKLLGLLQTNSEVGSLINVDSPTEQDTFKHTFKNEDLKWLLDEPIDKSMSRPKQLKKLMKVTCKEICSNAAYSVSMLIISICKCAGAIQSQYIIIYVIEVYNNMGLQQKNAENYMSKLNLYSIGCAFLLAIGFGWLSDKIKQWKLLTILGLLSLLFGSGFLVDLLANRKEKDNLGPLFVICLPLFFGFHVTLLMMGNVYLAKICNFQSRGTIFSLSGLISKITDMLLIGAGGYLYSQGGEFWVFAIMVLMFLPQFIITLTLGVCGKLQD